MVNQKLYYRILTIKLAWLGRVSGGWLWAGGSGRVALRVWLWRVALGGWLWAGGSGWVVWAGGSACSSGRVALGGWLWAGGSGWARGSGGWLVALGGGVCGSGRLGVGGSGQVALGGWLFGRVARGGWLRRVAVHVSWPWVALRWLCAGGSGGWLWLCGVNQKKGTTMETIGMFRPRCMMLCQPLAEKGLGMAV